MRIRDKERSIGIIVFPVVAVILSVVLMSPEVTFPRAQPALSPQERGNFLLVDGGSAWRDGTVEKDPDAALLFFTATADDSDSPPISLGSIGNKSSRLEVSLLIDESTLGVQLTHVF